MKKNNKWAAIMIGMFLIIFLTLTMYVLMAQVVPFSRNTAWIQNASNAYYQAYAWIEDSLYKKRESTLTNINYTSTTVSYKYDVSSLWSVVPAPWKWDSDNPDYSKISIWKPIQLKLQPWLSINSSRLCFKVPDFDWITNIAFNTWTDPIIFWSLSWKNSSWVADTLNWVDNLNPSVILSSRTFCNWTNWFNLNLKNWKKLNWDSVQFQNFYSSNCTWWCVLRLSVINELKAWWKPIPYLEYQIRMWGNIELYHTTIESSWKSYWFKKDLKVQVPQSTLNQAFDFTVFQ